MAVASDQQRIVISELPSSSIIAATPDGADFRRLPARGSPRAIVENQIVFVSGSDPVLLRIQDIDDLNGDAIVLVLDEQPERVLLSPDARSIALMHSDRLEIIDAATGESVWTREVALGMGPAWSPDSRQLAYELPDESAIYVLHLDGPYVTRVRFPERRYLDAFTWSPDSQSLDVVYRDQVWRLPVRQGGPRLISGTPISSAFTLQWSPDGEKLAVSSDTGIFVLDDDDDRWIEVGVIGVDIEKPDIYWSPDSDAIAYTPKDSDDYPGVAVAIAPADNSGAYALVMGTDCNRLVGWLPDGSVAYLSSLCF
jgi:dipeptidyl aminopeptidase/acylaminoacyl peptidase